MGEPKTHKNCIVENNKNRKVKFALRPIIILIEREDRKGPWEQAAVDRDRFNRRINDVENKIGWCFEPSHREKIFYG